MSAFRAAALAFGLLSAALAIAEPARSAALYFNASYNQKADPAADLRAAMAKADGRNILLEIGGDWCIWCKILDFYLIEHPNVRAEFAQSFLIVRVFYDPAGDENADFLSAYPGQEGFPAFIILGPDGAFRADQNTGLLEKGKSYDDAKMLAFARKWRPKPGAQ